MTSFHSILLSSHKIFTTANGYRCIGMDIDLWTWEFQGGPSVSIHALENYSVSQTKRYGAEKYILTHFFCHTYTTCCSKYSWQPKVTGVYGHRSMNFRVSRRSSLYRFTALENYSVSHTNRYGEVYQRHYPDPLFGHPIYTTCCSKYLWQIKVTGILWI